MNKKTNQMQHKMNQHILDRIKALGGNIDQVKADSWMDDLLSIRFDTVLYERPQDAPWADVDDQEPIRGLGDYIDAYKQQFEQNPADFYAQLIQDYYQLTEERRGQSFWQAQLFTPFQVGTVDFEEWNADFSADDIDLEKIRQLTHDHEPDFIRLVFRYGFPDQYYICLSDPNPENPTLWGTDHEVFFTEVSCEGTLLDFLERCMTPTELIAFIEAKINL